MMLNILKKRLKKWLDIDKLRSDSDIEFDAVWATITRIQEVDKAVEHIGGAVEAKGRVDYEPNQTGNVVVAEPKILSVERGKR